MQYLSIPDCLPLALVSSCFIHVIACIRSAFYQLIHPLTNSPTDYSQATLQEAAWGIPGQCCVHTEATMSSEALVLPDPVLMRVSDVQIHGVEVQRYL